MSILKLSLVFTLIIALMAGAFYWYFTYSQNKIGTLEQDTAKLTQAVQIQQQAMQDQIMFEKQQNADLLTLQTKLQDASSAEVLLIKKFLTTNIDNSARTNPKLVEDQINSATNQILHDIQAATQPGNN